jgi:hypothetical protein
MYGNELAYLVGHDVTMAYHEALERRQYFEERCGLCFFGKNVPITAALIPVSHRNTYTALLVVLHCSEHSWTHHGISETNRFIWRLSVSPLHSRLAFMGYFTAPSEFRPVVPKWERGAPLGGREAMRKLVLGRSNRLLSLIRHGPH